MPQPSAVREFELHDAEHVLGAVDRHWSALLPLGVTEDERAAFRKALAEAVRTAPPREPLRVALDAARLRLADLVGDYRSTADLVARPIDGAVPALERMLAMNSGFPSTGSALATYCARIAPGVRQCSAELARCGFGLEAQAALAAAAAAFARARAAMPRLRGEARRAAKDREAQLTALRNMCVYFRGVAYAAFEGLPEQVDFDRVKLRPNPFHAVGSDG